MNKVVALAVDKTPKYMYYVPLVTWAWRKMGWDTVVLYAHRPIGQPRYLDPMEGLVTQHHKLTIIQSEFPLSTVAQVSRLYAWTMFDPSIPTYVLTSDIDMLPLSNIWEPIDGGIQCYGRDLTDYHYPICYIGMDSLLWSLVTRGRGKDIDEVVDNVLSNRKELKWTTDQDIITEDLLRFGKDDIHHVNRGVDKRTGYPVGRVDRSNWRLDHDVLIDAHLSHDILTNDQSFKKVLELLHHVWPKEDFKWYIEYHKEFKKLI